MNIVGKIVNFIEDNGQEIFIEAEGKPSRIKNFVREYNEKYNESLLLTDDGLIILQDDANKWGLELRLYLNDASGIPNEVKVTKNTVYRSEYKYRINDKAIIMALFEYGYRIGLN